MSLTVEALSAAYEEEIRQSRPPAERSDIPISYEAITAQWLTAVLCAAHPPAQVLSFELDAPDNGNSNRRRIFIDYNEAGLAAGLPRSVFCKASHALANRISLGLSGGIHSEVNFYNHVRPSLRIETPRCRLAQVNAALNSIVMLDDLGEDVQFCTHTTPITIERARSQLRLLASLHGAYLESPMLDAEPGRRFPSWQEFFGRLDYPAFEAACDQGFAMAESVIPPRLLRRRKEIWAATRASVRRHDQLPATLTHGDDHLRNWYLTADGRMGITDWQACSRGHWSRDVAYVLSTSLSVEDRRRWERDLQREYLDALQSVAGRTQPFDDVFDTCRQQLMTVLAFWTITINPAPGMPDMQPRDVTLEFIRRIATAIDDLDVLDSF